jgi:uncharacterized protein (TIGR02145 family)
MKQILIAILLFALIKMQAQDYLIDFAASGASTTIDSVRVENLTQGTVLTVAGADKLQLLGSLLSVDPDSEITGTSLLVYPNPAKIDFILAFEATVNAKTTIELFDLSGRSVVQTQLFLSRGLQSFRISELNSGIYTIQVKSGSFVYAGKIISQSASAMTPQIFYQGQSTRQQEGNLKQSKTVVEMQYTTGDLLKFTGKSGIYATVLMDVPTAGKTITFDFAPCSDYDNNNYTIVQIGTQIWMAENLKSIHYFDGTSINYYDYDHDPNNSLIYGRLYAWSSAMNGAASSNSNPSNVQGVCPDGWHLPSKAEWQQLGTYLGGLTIAGGKMKETGILHWVAPNAGATNEIGFTALPAGIWAFWDEFQWKGDHCAFSTSTGNLPMIEVTTIMLQTTNGVMTIGTFHPDDAVSVRCVRN